jgi:GNAT superfamily N-acetyltransferase
MVQVRSATTADMELISILLTAMYEGGPKAGVLPSTKAVRDLQVANFITADYGHVWVAEDGTALVGIICALHVGNPIGDGSVVMETGWFVLPEYRSTGVGGRLFVAFYDWAAAIGATCISVDAWHPSVQAMLSKRGFQCTEVLYTKRLR